MCVPWQPWWKSNCHENHLIILNAIILIWRILGIRVFFLFPLRHSIIAFKFWIHSNGSFLCGFIAFIIGRRFAEFDMYEKLERIITKQNVQYFPHRRLCFNKVKHWSNIFAVENAWHIRRKLFIWYVNNCATVYVRFNLHDVFSFYVVKILLLFHFPNGSWRKRCGTLHSIVMQFTGYCVTFS